MLNATSEEASLFFLGGVPRDELRLDIAWPESQEGILYLNRTTRPTPRVPRAFENLNPLFERRRTGQKHHGKLGLGHTVDRGQYRMRQVRRFHVVVHISVSSQLNGR